MSPRSAVRRKQLREAEVERDAQRERVAGYERDTVTRLAGDRLFNPDAARPRRPDHRRGDDCR